MVPCSCGVTCEKLWYGERHETADAAALSGTSQWWFIQSHFFGSGQGQTGRSPWHPCSIPLEWPLALPRDLLLQDIAKYSCFSSPQTLQRHLVGGFWCTCEGRGWRCHRCHRRDGESGTQSRTGWERRKPTPSAPTAPLPSPHCLQTAKNLPAQAKKTHLPTHTVLTMKTLIIFHSPIKGMIHLGEWARRITQDEHGDVAVLG